jgi:hypothetical protein
MYSGSGYFGGMKEYLTKGKDGMAWGAGDWLMSFLGVVVLSFGFHIYGQRGLLMRHKFEVESNIQGTCRERSVKKIRKTK